MAGKRNTYLDASISEDEQELDQVSDLDEPGRASRTSKRRKLAPTSSHSSNDEDDAPSASDDEIPDAEERAQQPRRIIRPVAPLRALPTASKTGILYLSRIPPFMKPSTLRSLLTPHGTISRIFLTPEPPKSHSARVRAGGNKKRSFTDGWVEFARKRDAKGCAAALNARTLGEGRRGGWYKDDVWNMKYLKGFKWHHLTAQIAGENAEREARLRTEIRRTGAENKAFVANVERAKMLKGMEAKRADRGDVEEKPERRERTTVFRQSEVRGRERIDLESNKLVKQPDEVQRVLSKIF